MTNTDFEKLVVTGVSQKVSLKRKRKNNLELRQKSFAASLHHQIYLNFHIVTPELKHRHNVDKTTENQKRGMTKKNSSQKEKVVRRQPCLSHLYRRRDQKSTPSSKDCHPDGYNCNLFSQTRQDNFSNFLFLSLLVTSLWLNWVQCDIFSLDW